MSQQEAAERPPRPPPPPLPDWAIPICALWRQQWMHAACFSGRLGDAKVYAFRNPNKRSPDDPELILCVASFSPRQRALEALATQQAAFLTEQEQHGD